MMTRGVAPFTKAILLVLLTSAYPSLQDSAYDPSSFSNWNELRNCAQQCLSDGAYTNFADSNLGCSLNDCFCRVDIIPQAVSIVSKCVSTSCSDTNDIVSATSFYEAYCASATNTGGGAANTGSPAGSYFVSSSEHSLLLLSQRTKDFLTQYSSQPPQQTLPQAPAQPQHHRAAVMVTATVTVTPKPSILEGALRMASQAHLKSLSASPFLLWY